MKTQFRTLIFKSPALVRDKIFTLVDPHTQLTLRKVCKSWKRLVDQVIPFRVTLNEQTFKDVHKFIRTHKIGELAVGYFSQPFPDPKNAWKFQPQALTILLDESKLTPQKKKKKDDANKIELLPEAKLENLFREFCSVQNMTLDSRALSLIQGGESSFMRTLEFSYLKSLDLFVDEDKGFSAIQDLLSLTCPMLRDLSIGIKNDDDMSLYEEFYSFVGRNRSIKKVTRTVVSSTCHKGSNTSHIDRSSNLAAGVCVSNFLQVDHNLAVVTYAEVLQNLGQVQLNHLDIKALTSEGCARKNLELHLFRAQTKLSTLHISNIRMENMPVWRTIPAILSHCSALKSVILDGCFCGCDVYVPGPFWGHWVENCVNLKRLEVLICGIKVTDIALIPNKIKTLCLGHRLTQRQMRTVCDTFPQLEELSWPQLHTKADVCSDAHDENDADSDFRRVVTTFQFKRACTLPKLKKLTLSSTSCKLNLIRKFAGPLMGVYENYLESGACKRGDLQYTFDRKIFSYANKPSSPTKIKVKTTRTKTKRKNGKSKTKV